MSRAQANARMERQLSDGERAARSNIIIENNGSLAELEEKLRPLADGLLG